MNKKILFLILHYFFISSIYITFPLIFHLTDYIFGYGDEALITWIMNWNIYSILHNPLQIYNAPLYFPYKNTLAYSDTFFTSSLLSFIPTLIIKEPMIAYNLNVFFSLTTLGFFTFLLVRYITRDIYAGVISGTLVAFSTFTLQRLPHLQLISIQWIPLTLLFIFYFIKKKKFKYIFLANFFFLLQTYNSILPGYFIICAASVIIMYLFFKNKKQLYPFLDKKMFVLFILDTLFILALTLPYFNVSKEFSYVRDIRDTINFANRPEYILYPNDNTRLKPILNIFYANNKSKLVFDGYFGFPLLILSLITVFFWLKNKYKNFYQDVFILTAITSLILSLGPAFQWGGKVLKHPFIIPLPYAFLYYIIPGFKGLRNSGRWEMLSIFAFSVAVGVFISIYFKKLNRKIYFSFMLLVCLSVLLEFNFPRVFYKIEKFAQFPHAYQYISQLPNNTALIELPYYNWNMTPYGILENKRAFYSTIHNKNRVNGGSGFSPPEWERRTLDFIYGFPNQKTVSYLKSIGITHILIHKSEYDSMFKQQYKVMGRKVLYWDELQVNLVKFPEIKLLKQFGNDFIYTLK